MQSEEIFVVIQLIRRMQEAELLGDNLARCSAPALTQKGQFSPLSPILTAQVLCKMKEMSTESSSNQFKGENWKGLNIGQTLELMLGDDNQDQVSCACLNSA